MCFRPIRVLGVILFLAILAGVQGRAPARPGAGFRIVIRKAQRQLLVYVGPNVTRTYRIALGLQPVGAKEREGDRRTPEGLYYVCGRNAHSQFYRSLAISYPNIGDATRGLQSRLISRSEYAAIVRANRHKQVPPQNTALGGAVFIHGRGSSRD